LCGSQGVLDALRDHLKVDVGETTKDGQFTLIEVECLGACANAPMMQIGDDFFEDLTPSTAVQVVKEIQAGRKPKVGPQNGRVTCEPLGKRTSLFDMTTGPLAPNLDK
jgi:NADH dehydrogenase (ubiquinone) flavoprotein 2